MVNFCQVFLFLYCSPNLTEIFLDKTTSVLAGLYYKPHLVRGVVVQWWYDVSGSGSSRRRALSEWHRAIHGR